MGVATTPGPVGDLSDVCLCVCLYCLFCLIIFFVLLVFLFVLVFVEFFAVVFLFCILKGRWGGSGRGWREENMIKILYEEN